MTLTNFKKIKAEKGFTIVELLIVIVIIGILAAITIIAYNGITQRANTSSALSAANSAVAKSEAYNADTTSGYPTTGAALTGATSDKTYQLTGVTFDSTLLSSGNVPAKPSELNFISCGAGVGTKIGYWDYTAKAIQFLYSGSATAANCTGTTPA